MLVLIRVSALISIIFLFSSINLKSKQEDIVWLKPGISNSISKVSISLDKNFVAICEEGRYTIKIIDANNGNLINRFYYYIDDYTTFKFFSFSTDNKSLLIGIQNDSTNEIIFWDFKKNEIINTYTFNVKNISYMRLSQDKRIIYAVDNKYQLYFWDIETGVLKKSYDENSDYWAYNAILTDDNKYIVGVQDKRIFVFNIVDSTLYYEIPHSYLSPTAQVAISPDMKKIIRYSGSDRTVFIYDLETGDYDKSMILPSDNDWIVFTKDSKFFLTFYSDGVYFWDIDKSDTAKVLKDNIGAFDIDLNSDNQIFVNGTSGIKIWDFSTSKLLKQYDWLIGINSVKYFNDDNNFISLSGNDFSSKIWDVKTSEFIKRAKKEAYSNMLPNKKQYFIIKDSTALIFYDVLSEDSVASYQLNNKVSSISFSNDLKYYVSKVKNHYKIAEFPTNMIVYENDSASGFIISPKSNYFIESTGSYSNYGIIIRELISGKLINNLNIIKPILKFSSDEKYIYNKTDSGYYQIYDIHTGNLIKEFQIDEESKNSSTSYYISQDNKYLIEGLKVGIIRIYNIEENRIEYVYDDYLSENHLSDLWGFTISSDLNYLLATYADGTLILYKTHNIVSVDENKYKGQLSIDNYPNPFSQSTSINFILAENFYGSLIIYDIFGNEIETIFSGYLDAGEHRYNWVASGRANGAYYYRLQVGNEMKTGVMVLDR